ncbi:putative zinc transporter 5, partial [Apostichopus japonicus]
MLPGSSNLGRVSQTSLVPFILLLLTSKAMRSFGIFLIYDLLKFVHLVIFVFIIKAGSTGLLVVTQKPFTSGKRITKHQWMRIIRHALGATLITLLWLFGLTLCGPLRGVLLFEHSDVVVGGFVAVVFTSRGVSPARTRAAVMFFIAILSLLLFDVDLQPTGEEHPEGPHKSALTHLFYQAVSWLGVSDHKGGVLLLVLTLLLSVAFKNTSRKLSVDVGGSKRLHALSTFVSSLMLFPWAMIHLFIHEQGPTAWWPLILPLASIVLIVFVLDFYVESVCSSRLESYRTARYSTYALLLSAVGFSFVWGSSSQVQGDFQITEHAITGGVILATALFLLATRILGQPAERQGSAGSFVGYTRAGRPLYNITGDALQKTSQSLVALSKNILRQILEEYDSRQIFYFLCINMAFTFVELIYGVWTNSLGLISDGFHMMFDCTALVFGLTAAVMSHWKATRIFSYGYGRVEVLSGFVNGLFLVVIGYLSSSLQWDDCWTHQKLIPTGYCSHATVTMQRLPCNGYHAMVTLAHSTMDTHMDCQIATAMEPVNRNMATATEEAMLMEEGATGMRRGPCSWRRGPRPRRGPCSWRRGHGHGGGGHASEGGKAKNRNMQGVYLHVLADTMGSVGVIISSLLIDQFGILIADPICSVFISVMILLSVVPLLKDTASILLQRTPPEVEPCLSEGFAMVHSLDGCYPIGDHISGRTPVQPSLARFTCNSTQMPTNREFPN